MKLAAFSIEVLQAEIAPQTPLQCQEHILVSRSLISIHCCSCDILDCIQCVSSLPESRRMLSSTAERRPKSSSEFAAKGIRMH